MSILVASNGCRVAVRVAVTGLTLALLSGCSSDVTRFANPFSNPFGSAAYAADETPTADILPRKIKRASITSKALEAPTAQSASASRQLNRLAAPAHASPVLAHAKTVREPMTTASVARHPVSSLGGWSAAGGTPIVVATGETVAMLSRRYGVPENAMLSVNGFNNAAQVQPGTRMVVPVYNAVGQSAQSTSEVFAPRAQAPAKMKFVRGPQAQDVTRKQARLDLPKQTKIAQSAKSAQVAKAEKVKKLELARAQLAKREKIHVMEAVNAKPAARPGVLMAKHIAVKPVQVANAVPAAKARMLKPVQAEVDTTPTASLPAKPVVQVPAASVADANPEFRWPARGRIIQAFKSGGNDGINIAVPEGTSVKAAEGGVVAYAGSELKGYGNLVLIRHPNGFVSAYANNGELDVKRGETVRRGQVIAKSGQTGNVSSPQLHFELRKGSTPVDPTQYLAGL